MYRVKRVRFNILAASISAFSAKAPCGSTAPGSYDASVLGVQSSSKSAQ
jgi:hypothetical protein